MIIHGDCTDESLLPAGKADLIITSPPYNVGKDYARDGGAADERVADEYSLFTAAWLDNCLKWAKPNGRLCVNVPPDTNRGGYRPVAAELTELARELGWRYRCTILWETGNITRRTAWGSYRSPSAPNVMAPVELIIVFYKGGWARPHGGSPTIGADEFKDWVLGHWRFKSESAKAVGHPAPFPIELPRRLIRLFSYREDTILDPFLGSGTTAVAAKREGRKWLGIERESEFVGLARQRVQAELDLCS